MSEGVLVEACVDSIESALAAVRGGAHGIELCANLVEGGTTPSAGTLAVCRERLDIPIHVLVRPRGGDFLYTAAEFTVMLEDIRRAKQAGAEGVVTGALRAGGEIDTDRTRELIGAARPLRVTFHRAFDVCRDPAAALEALIVLGVDRVLTSGQAATAPQGAKARSEEHTSELQSLAYLVCRLLLEKKKKKLYNVFLIKKTKKKKTNK